MKGSRLSQAQTDHLLKRIKDAENATINAIPKSAWEIEEPPAVKKARALLAEWDNYRGKSYKATEEIISHHNAKVEKAREAAWSVARKAAERVRTIVLFKDPDTALAAVEAYEKSPR